MDAEVSVEAIGYWSELKLEIIDKYARAYSRIVSPRFHHVYIDAFSGAGINLSRSTGELVAGSPLNALHVEPPFREYHLVDTDGEKAALLRTLAEQASNRWSGDKRPLVRVYEGDCNVVLPTAVLPTVRYEEYKRGLCLLDPYGMHLDWNVVEMAGRLKTIDLFLNFPIMDINRNALRRDPGVVTEASRSRMTSFWGDESWRRMGYRDRLTLFGDEPEKVENEAIVGAYCERLKKVAGFKQVIKPLPMCNRNNAVVYYLVFASQQSVAGNIVGDIFYSYRGRCTTA